MCIGYDIGANSYGAVVVDSPGNKVEATPQPPVSKIVVGSGLMLRRGFRGVPVPLESFVAADQFVVGGEHGRVKIASMTESFQKYLLIAVERPEPMLVRLYQTTRVMSAYEMIDSARLSCVDQSGSIMLAHFWAMMVDGVVNTEKGLVADGARYVAHVKVGGVSWLPNATWSHDQRGWLLDAQPLDPKTKVFQDVVVCYGCPTKRHYCN